MSKRCISCNSEIRDEAVFCTVCGIKQVIDESEKNAVIKGKSKMTAGLLAIFLGVFGVHNFYLKNYPKAILQLLLTVLSMFKFTSMVFLWALVEAALIFSKDIDKDGEGNLLID